MLGVFEYNEIAWIPVMAEHSYIIRSSITGLGIGILRHVIDCEHQFTIILCRPGHSKHDLDCLRV